MHPVYACILRFPCDERGIKELFESIWREVNEWVCCRYNARKESGQKIDLTIDETLTKEYLLEDASRIEVKGYQEKDSNNVVLYDVSWVHPHDDDPGLRWHISVSVLKGAKEIIFCLVIRISATECIVAPPRIQLGAPRIVKTLVGKCPAFISGIEINDQVYVIKVEDVPSLVEFIKTAERRIPIIVLSKENYNNVLIFDPSPLAQRLLGLAVFVVLEDKWTTYKLSEALGKGMGCYNGALRIYWPRFREGDLSAYHKCWLGTTIRSFRELRYFENAVFNTVCEAAAMQYVEPSEIAKFRAVVENERIKAIKERTTTSYDELYRSWSEMVEINDMNIIEKQRLLEENDAIKQQLYQMCVNCKTRSSNEEQSESGDNEEYGSVLDAVLAARERFTNILFLDSAIESAKDSPYSRPDNVFQALDAINDVAEQWKKSISGAGQQCSLRNLFRTKGYEYKDGISQTSEGKWGEEYKFIYKGEKVLFENHITLGAKQPNKCLSIHMYRDHAVKKIVIGHVGRHLTNTNT